MTRVETVRSEVKRLVRTVPFRPFALSLENGERIVIEHPENIAFDPSSRKANAAEFHVISSRLRVVSTFDVVTSVSALDRGD